MLIHCPLCSTPNTEQVLSQYKVTVRKERDSEIGALATFRCARGHIFFVRLADLMIPEAMAESYEKRYGRH
jgi:hypothetical protein